MAAPPGAASDGRVSRTPWVVAGCAAIALAGLALAGAVGWYLYTRPPAAEPPDVSKPTRVDTIDEYTRAMREQGWTSLEDEPSSFVAKSLFDIEGGFVQLIQYIDADIAEAAQADREELLASTLGYSAETRGTVRLLTTGDPATGADGPGSVEVLLGDYRFEGFGVRRDIESLVAELGYLSGDTLQGRPFDDFRKAVRTSGLATSHDQGYSARSAFEKNEMDTEYKIAYSEADARADYDGAVESCKESDLEYGASADGPVLELWFITSWDAEGNDVASYVRRVYIGDQMLFASGPVEDRDEIDALMTDLGY